MLYLHPMELDLTDQDGIPSDILDVARPQAVRVLERNGEILVIRQQYANDLTTAQARLCRSLSRRDGVTVAVVWGPALERSALQVFLDGRETGPPDSIGPEGLRDFVSRWWQAASLLR